MPSTNDSLPATVTARVLLRLYPRAFRRQYGPELELALERGHASARSAGRLAGARFLVSSTWSALRNGLAAHVEIWRLPGGHPGRARPLSVSIPVGWLLHDLSHSLRSLRRSPGFSAAVILLLGLGIGANTAIFSIVNATLLRPLPYPDPERLYTVWVGSPTTSASRNSSMPDFLDYRRHDIAFEDFAALASYGLNLTGDSEPQRLHAARASGNFLPLLGVELLLGRHFTPEEDREGGPHAVILSHGLWQQRFAADPRIIGRTINLSGEGHTVVGVLRRDFRLRVPRTFQVTPPFDIWTPLRAEPERYPRSGRYLLVIGRLRPEVPPSAAQAEADQIAGRLRREHTEHAARELQIRVEPLHADLVGDVRRMLLALLAAVGFVLLIASTNVTSMLSARLVSRQHELAIRAALGAGRRRLLSQAIWESVVLAMLGGAVGLTLSSVGLRLFQSTAYVDTLRVDESTVDGRVLAFTVGLSLAAAAATALISALNANKSSLYGPLRSRVGLGRDRLQRVFIVVEVAVSLMLLVGAGLMIRSLVELTAFRPGFDAENLVTFELSLPESSYEGNEEVTLFFNRLEQGIAALPGVESIGLGGVLPLKRAGMRASFVPPGAEEGAQNISADVRIITLGYFGAMGTRLLDGRNFGTQDRLDSRKVVIIDESIAQRISPGESAVGHHLELRTLRSLRPFEIADLTLEIIGVVEHVRHTDITDDVRGQLYRPHSQLPVEVMSAVVRTPNGMDLMTQLRREVAKLDPALPLADVEMMTTYVATAMASTRFTTYLFGLFGSLAALLACAGVYGMMSYIMSRRVREMGIRMALGSGTGRALRQVISDAMKPAVVGVVLGLAGAATLSRFLSAFLYDVQPLDAAAFTGAALAMLAAALIASFVPAWRASRVDPLVALRNE